MCEILSKNQNYVTIFDIFNKFHKKSVQPEDIIIFVNVMNVSNFSVYW